MTIFQGKRKTFSDFGYPKKYTVKERKIWMSVLTLTKENFEQEVLSAAQPVLVDFWASWCGPCRMFSPIVDEFAEENEGKIVVGKVNVDEEPELAARFGVMSIPTAILFRNGQISTTMVGLQPKEKLEELLEG